MPVGGIGRAAPLYDREILTQAARLAHVEEDQIAEAEHHHGVFGRLFEGMGQVSAVSAATLALAETLPQSFVYSSADFRQIVAQLLRGLAATGSAVVLGHAGQAVLRDRSDVLKVFLHAPVEDRIRRLVATRGMFREQAQKTIERREKERAAFFHTHHHLDRYDLRLYDLTVNTAGRTYEEVAEEISQAAERLCIRLNAR